MGVCYSPRAAALLSPSPLASLVCCVLAPLLRSRSCRRREGRLCSSAAGRLSAAGRAASLRLDFAPLKSECFAFPLLAIAEFIKTPIKLWFPDAFPARCWCFLSGAMKRSLSLAAELEKSLGCRVPAPAGCGAGRKGRVSRLQGGITDELASAAAWV